MHRQVIYKEEIEKIAKFHKTSYELFLIGKGVYTHFAAALKSCVSI
jgi:hypothetical protein